MRRLGSGMGLVVLLLGLCAGCGKSDSKTPASEEPAPLPMAEASPNASTVRAAQEEPNNKVGPKIKAHRGASTHAPENTIAAVQLGFASGAEAAEIDVRLSADGVVVVIHDEDTDRVAGRKRKVSEQTLAELKELDVGSWMDAKFASERIPTLDELLLLIPEGKTLFVEIKDGPESVPMVIESIKSTKSHGTFAIESYSLEVLKAVGIAMPALPRHWTMNAKQDPNHPKTYLPLELSLISQAKALGFAGLSIDARGLHKEFAEATRKADMELAVWTVDSPVVASALAQMPITYIETNVPGLIRKALYE